jgi:hypothetical protein
MEKTGDIALGGGHQLHSLPVHSEHVPQVLANQQQYLAQGPPGGRLGRLTPEERGQLIACVGAGFQSEVGKERETFGARRWVLGDGARSYERGRAQEGEESRGCHGSQVRDSSGGRVLTIVPFGAVAASRTDAGLTAPQQL